MKTFRLFLKQDREGLDPEKFEVIEFEAEDFEDAYTKAKQTNSEEFPDLRVVMLAELPKK